MLGGSPNEILGGKSLSLLAFHVHRGVILDQDR